MGKPDWTQTTCMHGGHVKDIPEPWVLLHPRPDGVKRRVTVHVTKYQDVGHHFYVRIEEEKNYVWNGKTWCRPWGPTGWGPTGRLEGLEFSGRFNTPVQVTRFVNKTLRKFNKKTHERQDGSSVGVFNKGRWDWQPDFDPDTWQ